VEEERGSAYSNTQRSNEQIFWTVHKEFGLNKAFKKLLHAGAVALVATSLGVAATQASTSHAKPHATAQVLRFDNWISSDLALAASLDPAYISAAADYNVVQWTHVALVQNLPTGKVAKQLASKIKVSNGGKTYTFTMHHWKFFNGHPITAADEVYSIKRALRAPGSQVNYYDLAGYGDIKGADAYANNKTNTLTGVKALGKYVVQIQITKPIAYFLQALTYPINMPVDPAVAGKQPASATNNYLTSNCPAARADAYGQ